MRRLLGSDARADLERYRFYDIQKGIIRSTLSTILAHQGLQAMLLYRVARSIKVGKPTILKRITEPTLPLFSRANDIFTGINISPYASIGPGCFIAHFGGVIIGPGVRLGANCDIGNNVTLGGGSPIIGDRVLVAVGARVLGDVRIGSDAAIGANAVVVRDIAERVVAVGVPAHAVSCAGAFRYVEYPGAEKDPARLAAMRESAKGGVDDIGSVLETGLHN
jgi:serine O-acetyltransferase